MLKYEGILMASPNPGRYEVGEGGLDLASGDECEVFLAGQWVSAVVRHSRGRNDADGMMAVERPRGVVDGYYLTVVDDRGNMTLCGLCTGMCVRVL